MTFEEYHKKALATADEQSEEEFQIITARVLGVIGEAGEIAEKFKKIVWHKAGSVSDSEKEEFKKELGDVLWYIAALSDAFGYTINDVAEQNIDKLANRVKRNKLRGSGDNR